MKSILVVDDDIYAYLVMRSTLKEYSFEYADSAKKGYQILLNCSKKLPDLILLDIRMPEEDGFAFYSQLKAFKMWAKIPVIFLTGMTDKETEISCLNYGAYDYITKPVIPDILRRRIENVLDHSALQKSSPAVNSSLTKKKQWMQNKKRIELYLENLLKTTNPVYVKAKDVSRDLKISSKAAGQYLHSLSKEGAHIIVKQWSMSNGTTWYVELKTKKQP
ncbi:MAG TPA: response regulator [Methanocorpusculum sp.]|nr:response regulator [Methanocorpusculum sp.]